MIHSQTENSRLFSALLFSHIMPFVEFSPAVLRKVSSPSDLLDELFLDSDLTQFRKNRTGEFKNNLSLLTWVMEVEVILVATLQVGGTKSKGDGGGEAVTRGCSQLCSKAFH